MAELRRKLPPLRQLLAFESAARLGSFTAAAEELFISQPAISRQVRALEDNLGLSLFERRHKGVQLSEVGQLYHASIFSALGQIAEVSERLRASGAAPRITLYANYGLATYWLLPRLAVFLAENPSHDVVVKTLEADRKIHHGQGELAIRFGTGHWRDGDVYKLFSERAFVVASPAYLEGAPPLDSAADLPAHRLIKMEGQPDSWLDWPFLLKGLGVEAPRLSGPGFNNYTLSVQAALAGQGLAVGWSHISDEFLERGWLVQPLPDSVATDKGYYVVADPQGGGEPHYAQLLAWLLAQVDD